MASTMTLLVALFVVLSSDEVISPSLKGLAMSYTIQVRLDSKFNICKQLQRVFTDCVHVLSS